MISHSIDFLQMERNFPASYDVAIDAFRIHANPPSPAAAAAASSHPHTPVQAHVSSTHAFPSMHLSSAPHTVPQMTHSGPLISPMPQNEVCDAVLFCFNACPGEVHEDLRGKPDPARPRGYTESAVAWALDSFGDKYKHVECLFHYRGNPEDNRNWRCLTVFQFHGSAVYFHGYKHFKEGRWDFYRMVDLPVSIRSKLWEFAVHENDHPRAYSDLTLLNTVPSTSWLSPIINYTPCLCCVPRPKNTVYCAQLLIELMKYAFPKDWAAVPGGTLRPDGFLAELKKRHHMVQVNIDLMEPNQRSRDAVLQLMQEAQK